MTAAGTPRREVAPGTVAAIRDTYTGQSEEWRAVKDDKGWASLDPAIGWVSDADVTSVRPLVVLDLDRLPTSESTSASQALRQMGYVAHSSGNHRESAILDEIATQIEAQTRPSKPDEPTGLGAVVKDRDGKQWVRDGGAWISAHSEALFDRRSWSKIDAVEVLSEGVT